MLSLLYSLFHTLTSMLLCTYHSHPDTVIVAMTGLSESEVRELLERYLGNTKAVISKELVKNVLKASSGSPFWCATIAKVISCSLLRPLKIHI